MENTEGLAAQGGAAAEHQYMKAQHVLLDPADQDRRRFQRAGILIHAEVLIESFDTLA